MADTRKDKRAPVSLKVRFKSATVDEFIEHYSKDVSRGGIFIKSSQPMPVGTLLKFQFQLKDESALIRGVGRVVWTRAEEDAGDDQPAGMGIKFIKMDNESRITVERIVDSHEPEQGTYERGRSTATTAEATSSAPPPASASGGANAGSFFPNLPPAELPPPEDRTAVRQAAQFLASALTEAGTDKAATREAQQKAEEAQKRTQEIENERRKEAEQRKRKEPTAAEPLPSMIIDPSLEPSAASEAERATEINLKPVRDSLSVESARAKVQGSEPEREPDTEPPPPMNQTTTTSIPNAQAERPPTRWVPIAVIAALLAVAAVVALRGGPEELPVEQLADKTDEESPARIEPAPSEPAEANAIEAAPAAVEPAPEAPNAEPPPSEPPAPPAALVKVDVVTTPRGAQVSVDNQARGEAPLALELELDKPVVVTASAPGYATASAELTPKAKPAPLKLKLKALPYIVHVESTPAGASVNVGGHKGTTPVDLKLDAVPTAELSVNAKLAGHDSARTRLAPSAFAEHDGAMWASLDLTLTPDAAEPKEAPPAAPKERAKRSPRTTETEPTAQPSAGEPAAEKPAADQAEPPKSEPPKSEPPKAETAKPDAPKPDAPKPDAPKETSKPDAPKDNVPDNPFGNE